MIGVVYFFGVAAVIYPIIGKIYTLSLSHSTIKFYDESVGDMPGTELSEKLDNAKAYNEKLASGIIDEQLSKSLNNANGLMCYVDVPHLGIYLPVFYGTDNDVLGKGCGWIPNTSLPVGGISTHACISGHTGMPDAEMFTRLDNAKTGEEFYIHVLGEILAYRIDMIETVLPDDTSSLEIIENEDHVTLVTCTPYGINDKRLLVRGTRIPYVNPVSDETSKEITYQISSASDDRASQVDESLQKQINDCILKIVIIVVVSVVLFAAACIWLSIMFRRITVSDDTSVNKKQSEDNNGKRKE